MKYLLKLLKKILSVTIIISVFNLMIPNTIISKGVYDEKILKKLLRTLKKRSPILEKQVLTLKKMLSVETHRNKILEDLKQFRGGKHSDPWNSSKLSEMYVYKVFKKLDIPMEKMLICSKDLFWFPPSRPDKNIINLLNPASLQYIVQGSMLNNNNNIGIFQKKVFKNNKYTDKLNEALEMLKTFQRIQYDAFNENVEDEIIINKGKENYRFYDGNDLNGPRLTNRASGFKSCSEKNINKKWATTRGSGRTILFLAVSNNNICFGRGALFGIFGAHMEKQLNNFEKKYNPLENISKKYLRIITNMYNYFDEIGIPHCNQYFDFGKRSFSINQYIKQNYVEEEGLNVDDLK